MTKLNHYDPCGATPCNSPKEVDLNEVLINATNQPYLNELTIDNAGLIISDQIIKVKTLKVLEDAKLQLDLDNNHEYFVFVIERIEMEIVSPNKYDLQVEWYNGNSNRIYNRLNGAKGQDAPPVVNPGENGLPGGTGGKGGTRHSPTLFFFIKEIVANNGNVNDVTYNFKLQGWKGGAGGAGGNGGDGMPGKKGRSARNGTLGTCKRGPGRGTNGGNPGFGGRGGDGGCGGNGPDVHIHIANLFVLWDIFHKCKYDLRGADIGYIGPEPGIGNGGPPGTPGKHGIGGKGGNNAGNCTYSNPTINKGNDGQPIFGSEKWKKWHMGWGLPGTAGKSGVENIELLDDVTNIVFVDPTN
ncbi:hypothetical protein FGF1_13010 [Flavobacteriaceae bacterium GF1]